jgi:hypothetical protein
MSELKHEVRGKTIAITFNRFVQSCRINPVQNSEVDVEDDLMPSEKHHGLFNAFGRTINEPWNRFPLALSTFHATGCQRNRCPLR